MPYTLVGEGSPLLVKCEDVAKKCNALWKRFDHWATAWSSNLTLKRGGIIIPDTAKEKPQEGTVTAVGSGRFLDNGKRSVMELGVGDHVLFARYGGTEIILNDEIYLVLRKCDILAVLD